MTPDQFEKLLQTLATLHGDSGFNWIQGMMALGATLVSVTGVVVGMRSAIATLAQQLHEQGNSLKELTHEVQAMARELAVIKYASGIESETGKVRE